MLLLLVGGLLAVGRLHPGSGADAVDWRPTRSPEVEAENEIEDLEQMLAAQNERRRRKGLPERTEDHVRADVAAFERELARYRAHGDGSSTGS